MHPFPPRPDFTTVAFLDEVCADPELLLAYAETFTGVPGTRLAIYAPDAAVETVAARLQPIAEACGLDARDLSVDVLAVDSSRETESHLATLADAVYTARRAPDAFAAVPAFERAQLPSLLAASRAAREAGSDAGVFVLGMHRSGTSVTTRLISFLGIPLNVESDWIAPAENWNPTGFWESASLVDFNEAIVARLGCTVWTPPRLAAGWELQPQLADLREQARARFKAVFPTDRWVWKDPRTSLTFAFWRQVLDVRPVVVLAYRNPLQVAHSIERGGEMTKVHGLAIWERYVRQAISDSAGLPVLVTDYDSMLLDLDGWYAEAQSFFGDNGFEIRSREDWRRDAAGFVDDGLRHSRFDEGSLRADGDVLPQQAALFRFLEERRGSHAAFSADGVPEESGWLDELLAAKREQAVRERDLDAGRRAA